MEPTFRPGDRLWLDTGAYRGVPVARNDVVVIVDPARSDRHLLKRVAGIAGDFVRVSREGAERISHASPEGVPGPESALEEIEVPPGHVFVLSDRPRGSRDSRQFGPVPLALVVGRVWGGAGADAPR
jgi:signal peptidase I